MFRLRRRPPAGTPRARLRATHAHRFGVARRALAVGPTLGPALALVVAGALAPSPAPSAGAAAPATPTIARIASSAPPATIAATGLPPTPGPRTTLAGRLSSPSDRVPALTVRAWSREAGRLYSTDSPAGPRRYALEVPPGRYVVFATPADPDAPPVYGAYTRFSLCARDAKALAAGACRDHAAVEVEVGRRRVTGVDVADWYLDDATIAGLDRALGRSAEAVDEAQLAAPRFSEYPASGPAALPRVAAPPLDPAEPRLERDRAALVVALAGTPTFAGHYALVRVGCTSEAVGSGGPPANGGCEGAAIVDLALGRVVYPSALNPLPAAGPCSERGALQYRRDSRLLTLTGRDGEQLVTRYFVWDGDVGRLRALATLTSAIAERCPPSSAATGR